MISSSIYVDDVRYCYPKAIQTALNYLKENADKFADMEKGVYEIQGKDIFAQVMDCTTVPLEQGRPEVHEKYVDVQFVVNGREKLGFTPDTGKYEVAERFDARDLIFYKSVENEGYVEARPGSYNIFFPADVHKPGLISGESMTFRKVVVKVAVALLKD